MGWDFRSEQKQLYGICFCLYTKSLKGQKTQSNFENVIFEEFQVVLTVSSLLGTPMFFQD